jgi:hypothetical protein
MKDGVHTTCRIDTGFEISNVADDRARMVTRRNTIKNASLVTALQQSSHETTPHESAAARNQNAHDMNIAMQDARRAIGTGRINVVGLVAD